ncbi:CubicO group peptidase, beta-lactamase class C family [Dyadobacter soli]|uniref:CubicO group peptidase, beta-lactamase class C family n=1 Tax=Dyadobacter soli TaxID=659014 RepID=A0A1G7LX87_9BACT|nr:serine hydrolase [Dyadobacter soli]SDF54112.1 CubicO group peptidase, beta-lactamase class C family [Dyadobacter soli]
MKKYFTFALFTIFGHFLKGQSVSYRIDSMFNRPGFLNGGVLVADYDRIIYQNAFGVADFDGQRPLQINDGFQSASVSKVFTSTAVLLLAQKGRLKLADPVQRYFPSFPYRQVTIMHLLNHTSGIPDVEVYDSLITMDPKQPVDNADLPNAIARSGLPLHFVPGAKFKYCNVGYQLLALLVEKVSGREFGIYLEKEIFAPAGMQHTRLKRKGTSVPVTNNVLWPGYVLQPRNVDSIRLPDTHPYVKRLQYDNYLLGATYGDQNVITTTGDLNLFTKAFLGGKLLGKVWIDLALRPTVLNDGTTYTENNSVLGGANSSYGLGWEVHKDKNSSKIGHSGYNRGIYVHYFVDVLARRTVVLFDNTEGSGFGAKLLNIINIIEGKPLQKVDQRKQAVRYFANALLKSDSSDAILQLLQMKQDTAHFQFSPQRMNQVGYDFLHTGHVDKAIETFKINLLWDPNDYNKYDSYGDALMAAGRKAEAIRALQRALDLNPKASEIQAKLRIWQQN